MAARAFVDPARSASALARALWIPWLSASRNFAVQYVLLQRKELREDDRGVTEPQAGGKSVASKPDMS